MDKTKLMKKFPSLFSFKKVIRKMDLAGKQLHLLRNAADIVHFFTLVIVISIYSRKCALLYDNEY